MSKYLMIFAWSFFVASPAWAWGRRGHSIVCQTAAYLVAEQPGAEFLKNHSFDLAYYCNVPDLGWKQDATRKLEGFNHHMNLEVFARAIPKAELQKAFAMDRKTFAQTYPKVDDLAGRSWWRIREFDDVLMSLKEKLLGQGLTPEVRHDLQGQWIMMAGLMGHYVGDLGMPLHVTENHDGKLTHQEGIHSFYEEYLVNELFNVGAGVNLEAEVERVAKARWNKSKAALAKESTLELLQEISAESTRAAPKLLATDREVGRALPKALAANKKMIIENLAAASVYLAELWRRGTGFPFDDNRFFNFTPSPKFIPVPN